MASVHCLGTNNKKPTIPASITIHCTYSLAGHIQQQNLANYKYAWIVIFCVCIQVAFVLLFCRFIMQRHLIPLSPKCAGSHLKIPVACPPATFVQSPMDGLNGEAPIGCYTYPSLLLAASSLLHVIASRFTAMCA